MLTSELGLSKEAVCDAFATLENSQATQIYLRNALQKTTNSLSKLSSRMIQSIETETGIKIEESNLKFMIDSYKKKKESLIAFYALRPWLIYNSQKPRESVTEWIEIYKMICLLEEGQENFGKKLVIKSDGSIEVE